MYACVFVCDWVSLCFNCGSRTHSCNLNRQQETQTQSGFMLVVDPDSSDSEIGPWDDPEIRTSSCSEDQTAIMFQNCVISCEYLFLSHFLIYHCQFVFYFHCYMWLFDVFYHCDYLHHFISHQWMSTLFIQLIWVFISIISCVKNMLLLA